MPKRKIATPRPSITAEARLRIQLFAAKVRDLQDLHGIEIDGYHDGILSLRDTRRKGDFSGWGKYDAFAKAGLRKLEIETFEGWEPKP